MPGPIQPNVPATVRAMPAADRACAPTEAPDGGARLILASATTAPSAGGDLLRCAQEAMDLDELQVPDGLQDIGWGGGGTTQHTSGVRIKA